MKKTICRALLCLLLAACLLPLTARTAHADKATQDAVLTYDKKAGKYVIQEEQVGGTIDTQALAEAVQTAAEQLQPELDAVGAGLYGGETVRRSDDEKLNQALEQANQMLKTDVTYTFEVERKNVYGEEQLNKSAIQKWLTVSEDGKRVQIDEDKVEDYVNEVARIYSVKEPTTAQFVTASGDHRPAQSLLSQDPHRRAGHHRPGRHLRGGGFGQTAPVSVRKRQKEGGRRHLFRLCSRRMRHPGGAVHHQDQGL